jgi:hypothetical protein
MTFSMQSALLANGPAGEAPAFQEAGEDAIETREQREERLQGEVEEHMAQLDKLVAYAKTLDLTS